eukprot:UN17419
MKMILVNLLVRLKKERIKSIEDIKEFEDVEFREMGLGRRAVRQLKKILDE